MSDTEKLIFSIVISLILAWTIKLQIKQYGIQKRICEEGAMTSAQFFPDEVIGKSIIKYEVDGKEYSHKMNMSIPSDSNEVTILYDRNNPKNFILYGKKPRISLFIIIFCSLFILACVAQIITVILGWSGNL